MNVENKPYCIYKHTSPNGKAYIGQTKNLYKRESDHRRARGSSPAEKYASPPPTVAPHPLQAAFDDCIRQVTKGKGERHGGEATPFFEQPWHAVTKQTGPMGPIFQAMKKAGESCGKDNVEDFERELLGAIAYLGMAYIFVQRNGFK